MSKVVVFIEETLCRGTEIDVPDELDLDEVQEMEYAEEKAKEMYRNEEIVLTSDDFTGNVCIMAKHENGAETSWNDM